MNTEMGLTKNQAIALADMGRATLEYNRGALTAAGLYELHRIHADAVFWVEKAREAYEASKPIGETLADWIKEDTGEQKELSAELDRRNMAEIRAWSSIEKVIEEAKGQLSDRTYSGA